MQHKITVPTDYVPKVWPYQLKDNRWVLEYFLPAKDKEIRTSLTLKAGTTENKARTLAKRKESDLAKGLLTEKEWEKLSRTSSLGDNWTIDQAVSEYISITKIYKSPRQQEKEITEIPRHFKFFQDHFKLTEIHQITEYHLIDYKNYLIKRIGSKEIAPTTGQTHLTLVKKVFTWLEENKKILVNPAKNLKPIRVSAESKARTKTFNLTQIQQVMKAPFEAKNGFPIKLLFLFLRETGARIGEALHLEWGDIHDGIWEIKHKPCCPTHYGLGWSPKWKKNRRVFLTPDALKILEALPKVHSVGYINNNPHPYPANFVFVIRDNKNLGGWRRVDCVARTWRGLLKAAGLPYEGADSFVRHDMRRTWNVEAKNVRGIDELIRSQQLGNSPVINRTNYAGEQDDETVKFLTKLRAGTSDNLLQYVKRPNIADAG